jgi:hypothetical protein
MNYKKIKFVKYTVMAAVVLSTLSCKKFLDVTPDKVGTIDYAFRNRNEAQNYLFTCYSNLQQMAYPQNNAGFVTSSEVIFPVVNERYYGIDPAGFNINRNGQVVDNPALNFWDGENNGRPLYKAIRMCNTMLENINLPVDLGAAEKARWIAEVKFLKAYYHYYLFRMYGPIPIVDVNSPIDSDPDELKVKRAPVNTVVNYISNLLDEAITGLPTTIVDQSRELGRVTKPIALAVKAEVLTTAASPLFNGNTDYLSLRNKDGEVLFPPGDATKWDKAADACLAAISACEAAGMRLHTFVPTGNLPANLPNELKTVLAIGTAITERWEMNTETVWALNPYFEYQGHNTPRLTQAALANFFDNPSLWASPISQQELYYTDKGLPIDQDKNWDYAGRNSVKLGNASTRYYIKDGYETIKGHFNREPRLYANLAFDGGVYYGNGNLNPDNPYFVRARGITGFAGPNASINLTGYWPKKLVNYLSVYDNGFVQQPFRLPLIRLASLYLLYAEALNEQGKSAAEVAGWIDRVRTRAGIQGVMAAWTNDSKTPNKLNSRDGMREVIHQERRIELAFEAQAGWDLRRWKELQGVLSQPLQGWNIYQDAAINYYRPTTVYTPIFNTRNYLWPIRSQNLIVNSNLVQNPGW